MQDIQQLIREANDAAVARKAFTNAIIAECTGKDTSELAAMIIDAGEAKQWARMDLIMILLCDALNGGRCDHVINEGRRGSFYLDEVLEEAA